MQRSGPQRLLVARSMVNINIELPDDLHKRLKIAAALDDTTLKDLFIRLLAQHADETR